MSNRYAEYIELLGQTLAANSFNSLELDRYSEVDFSSEWGNPLALKVKTYGFGRWVFNRCGVAVSGDEQTVRTLGLVLMARAISAPVPALRIRLETDLEVNLIYLEPIKGELNFYDCVPTLLEYQFCPAIDEYARQYAEVQDANRPSFGYLAQQDKADCLRRELSDWPGSVLLIGGTANSALRLGSMLLDLTHPDRPGMGAMHLERRFDQVCALTYSIDWELTLTETAKDICPAK